ncbi:MAG: ArsA family ATPase [Gemmatimonadaceae bacterium]
MNRLDALLEALPRWVLVAGKGGVGKTTCAAALAARSARDGDTLLLSTDPAESLGPALGTSVGPRPDPVEGRGHLYAMQLDARQERDAFLAKWRDVLRAILDRGTYLGPDDIAGIVDDALPGADEAMAVLALLELERDSRWRRIVVDTAPTGHTLRLLALPETFRTLVALLDTMQAKHRFMVQTLARRWRPDAADAFIAEMRERVDALQATLTDPARTAVVLVTRRDAMVVAETVRYAESLAELEMRVGAVIVNAVARAERPEVVVDELEGVAPGAPRLSVPLSDRPPNGLGDIEALFAGGRQRRALAARPARARGTPAGPAKSRAASVGQRLRPLTIVAGKGGVGKTTVACALGVSFAQPDEPMLIVSSDPAPSVGDALGQRVPDDDVAVDGAPACFARQMDATLAFDRFRARYAERIDAVFERLMSGSLSLAHDRAVMRDLLALAPPGIDELYALVTLGELLSERRYARVIVDPAPTGHLLRLLEMPALALAWAHRLMRIMLEYKEVAGLGEAARELLDFARRTRALAELMHDPARATVLVVANDEPLVRNETGRLVAACRERGMDVGAIIWNRAVGHVAPLSEPPAPTQFVAPTAVPPPLGAPELRSWCASWRALDENTGA